MIVWGAEEYHNDLKESMDMGLTNVNEGSYSYLHKNGTLIHPTTGCVLSIVTIDVSCSKAPQHQTNY